MKKIIVTVLLAIPSTFYPQSITEIDSVSYVMCDYLQKLEIENDTVKINTLYEKQLFPYLRNFDQSNAQQVGQQVFYRLQRNCLEFLNLLDRLEPPKEAVDRVTEKPIPEISKDELRDFKEQKEFYYYEVSGDTTKVLMDNGKWIDSFSDGTYSRLSYNWLKENEFELIFIESDNETRSNFSVKGDTYRYQVLSKDENFYNLSLYIPGQTTYVKFKMYFK
nr:hypothetical protein [Allomuricauda sp.]